MQIRSEDDKEALKRFTKEQLEIRAEWRNNRAKKVSEADMKIMLEQMKQAFIQMAGEKKNERRKMPNLQSPTN